MPYADVPEFIGSLRSRGSTAALAIEFAILTAARSGEVLGARWAEIDMVAKIWTIPASRMKAGREHRIPISPEALAILAALSVAKNGEFVFPGQRRGRPLSDGSMRALLRRMKVGEITIHGYRSSFRDWCSDVAHAPREIAESCLAHSVGSSVEQAYLRTDVLERRRVLMQAWGDFCERKIDANVVEFRAGAGSP